MMRIKYPKYDNYDAINVDRLKDIPYDYYGEMGVPITILEKFHIEQFELIRIGYGDDNKKLTYTINGKEIKPFVRIIIKRKMCDNNV